MDLLGRGQPILIISAAAIGIILGDLTPLGSAPAAAIEIFLMLLLYVLFLSVDLGQLKRSLTNVRFTASAAAINFVFTPLLAYGLGLLFFPDSADIRIGLMMLLVTPCTDWYIVFTGMSKGNVELGMSILPLNLVLQILLLPFYLLAFMGNDVRMDAASMLLDAAMVLAVPFFAALVTKRLSCKRENARRFLSERGDDLQLLFLCLAVVVMFASEGDALTDEPALLLKLFLPLLAFFSAAFILAQLLGRAQGFPRRDTVALNFTTLARNSPLALAIAVAAFPDRPLIALALVIGPLIELPVLSLVSSILRAWNRDGPATDTDHGPDR